MTPAQRASSGRGALPMSAKPKTLWQRLYGHKRPRSRWRRQREKRAARLRERLDRHSAAVRCFCCSRTFDGECSDAARTAHEYQEHRGAWLRRELLQVEREAKWGRFEVSDCRSWAFHPLARRYRRLMRQYWALDRAEFTESLKWQAGTEWPPLLPLTRLGWPSPDAAGLESYIKRERRKLGWTTDRYGRKVALTAELATP